jgi:hypothetical protein
VWLALRGLDAIAIAPTILVVLNVIVKDEAIDAL